MNKKLVVITGASSGFGKEMAKKFSNQGHPTLLLARRIDLMEKFVKDEKLQNTMIKKVDVTDYKSFQSAIEEAEETYGVTDLLINNAGVMLLGNIMEQNPKEWQTMLNVNLIGVLNGMQLVIKKMKENNTGTIINIASVAGIKTFPNHAVYCATKYGVRALTETTREEVANSNIRCLLISPGAAETELLSHTSNQEIIDGYNSWKETMGGKGLNPKEIANSAYFMYDLPQEVSIREIVIASTKQDS